jgi:hypothetical protein
VAGAVQVVARTIENERNLQEETYFNAHGITWLQITVLEPVGGAVPYRPWSMATATGETIIEGGNSGPATSPRRPFDYFLAVFPHTQLFRMVCLTSKILSRNGKRSLCAGEMLKFIGILVFGTRYMFRKRSDLWSTEVRNILLCAPAFDSKTGMFRNMFDAIWNSLTFILQGETRGGESSTEYRWRLVDDFV